MDFSKEKIALFRENEILTRNASKAFSLFSRLKGLLGKNSLASDEALILSPCTCVHTFFMKFPIDVAFIDNKNIVLALYSHLKPNRMTSIHWKAKWAIEFVSGAIEKWNIKVGSRITVKETHA